MHLKISSYANKYTLTAKHFSIKSAFAIKLGLIKMKPVLKLFSQWKRNCFIFP